MQLYRSGVAASSKALAARSTPRIVAPRTIARATATDVKPAKAAAPAEDKVEEKVPVYEGPDVQPSAKEVHRLLNTLVQDTNIAEMHLQVGNFELRVRRSTGSAQQAAAAPAPPPPTVVITQAPKPLETLQTLQESVDESLVPILSPKVGILRRGKYAAGKRVGKGNAVNQGDQVKKGQVLAYVEQLGTFVAVEAPQAGEVAKFLVEDGAPVEYLQEVVELAPFFGGHIIGDSKHA